MKMVAAGGRRARMALSLTAALGLSLLGPGAYAATGRSEPFVPTGRAQLVATPEAEGRGRSESSDQPSVRLVTQLPPSTPEDGAASLSAKAEVVLLLGSNDGSGIDPKIDKMAATLRAALKKPPLSAYNSYKLLERFEAQLDKGTAQTHTLPEGGKLSVTLKDIVKGKERDAKPKYVLTMSIEGRTVNLPSLEVNANQDDYFFVVAPQKIQGGALVIGLRILP